MTLSLWEQFTLRILTARVVGEAIHQLIPGKWGFITAKNYICSSLVWWIWTTILSKDGGLTSLKTLILEPGETPKENFFEDIENVFLAFGGESNAEQNYDRTLKSLQQLAKIWFEWDIFFHVRIWAPGFVEKAFISDENVAEFLTENPLLWTFTFDLEKGVFVISQPHFTWDKIHLHKIKEIPITYQHLTLLKASL